MSNHVADFTDLPNLAGERFGTAVIAANDEFFAPKEGLIKAGAPEWREGVYTERGKWMDGWETRRRRTPGYDWAIVRLGLPGVVRGVVIDTSFFTGNYPERASIDAWASSYQTTPMLGLHGLQVLRPSSVTQSSVGRPPWALIQSFIMFSRYWKFWTTLSGRRASGTRSGM